MKKFIFVALDSNANPTVRIPVIVSRDGDTITAKAGKLSLSVAATITAAKCEERCAKARGHRTHVVGCDETGLIENRSMASKQEEAIYHSIRQFLSAA